MGGLRHNRQMNEGIEVREYAIVPNLVRLLTNVERVKELGFCTEPLKYAGAIEETPHILRVRYLVVPDDSPLLVPSADAVRIASGYFASHNEDSVWHVVPVMRGKRIAMVLKGLGTEPFFAVNSFAHRFLRFPIYALLTPGTHLRNIVCVGLLQQDYLPLHGACIRSPKGEGILITALADTGKTTTTFQLLNRGFTLVAEDIVVTHGDHAYHCPFTATYTHSAPVRKELQKQGLLTRGNRLTLKCNDLVGKLPILNVFLTRSLDIGVTTLLERFETTQRTRIRYVFILRRANRDCTSRPDNGSLVREIMQLNHSEFSFWRDLLLLNYGYCYPAFEPRAFVQKEQEIIGSLVDNSEVTSHVIECANPMDFTQRILSIVG